ncbi:hypothetical protein BUALT_Bualt18G0004900 [Buddleja alternifolia]|uniref:Uncharacterized protein n=1 Tax=Buddleja alternifolia TaxID=168488 RepID=A0AAV6W7I6_9LAMI|nr:hypothetical protein BUALT_Bualt18G0004900 [Buddleja alternifolia]
MESITNVNPTITNDTPTDVDTPTKQPPFQYAPNKPFPDTSKIEIFEGNHFKRWQERVYSTLDVHGVAFILNEQKPNDGAPNINVWTYANKVSRHTILSTLSNELFDVYCPYKEARQIWESLVKKFTAEDAGQQKFAIGNYYHWQLTDEKEIKAQITEYYKLVEDLKSENIILPDEFVAGYKMQQVDQVKERPLPVNMGEVNFSQGEDGRLETTRARFSSVLKRHGELTERLSRDSDKTVFERLQREFEAARASQTQEICLDGEQWNDGLLATIRERVHMEAERKAMQLPGDGTIMPNLPSLEKITYRIGNKLLMMPTRGVDMPRHPFQFVVIFTVALMTVADLASYAKTLNEQMICCLEGARIGIQYETTFAGETCELFHCILESKSFLEKMTVLEHTIPFFLPIREAENDFLSSNAMKFIDHAGDLLQAYVDRREQVRLIKELYGNQIGELYFSLPYHMIEFVLADFDCKVTVSLRYADLLATLPSVVSVLAWPMQQPKKSWGGVAPINRKEYGPQPIPARLLYAEEALRSMSLPEAFAEIVLHMPQSIKEIFPEQNSV